MAWIDSVKPSRPVLLFDSAKARVYKDSIELYLRQDIINNEVNRYVIYNFDDISNIDKSSPKNIRDIIIAGNNYYNFNFRNIPWQQNKIVIAATALTSTNNESILSRYIYLERKQNGWQVISQPDNK